MDKIVVLNAQDNVATCLTDMKAGQSLEMAVGTARERLTFTEDVAFGHKVALRSIEPGQEVLKYGEVIGVASRAIAAGQWVHVHNVESVRARGDKAP